MRTRQWTTLAAGAALLVGTAISWASAVPALVAADATTPGEPSAAVKRLPDGRTVIFPRNMPLPIVISQSGSYVLGGDVLDCVPCGDPPTGGIRIEASDVTFDLNGFSVVGDPGNSLDGIAVEAGRVNVLIRDGRVRDWQLAGINAPGDGVRVEGVTATNNGGDGISAGIGAQVSDCQAHGNQGNGILVGFGGEIIGCTATGNAGDGLVAAIAATTTGGAIIDSTARGNGDDGFEVGDGSTIDTCSASFNGDDGFAAGPGSVIRGSAASLNSGSGFEGFHLLLHGNAAHGNSDGNFNCTDCTLADNHDTSF